MAYVRLNQRNLDQRPALLKERLAKVNQERRLRLRALLIKKGNSNWGAKFIILQGFRSEEISPEAVSSINLGKIVLHESWLTPIEAIDFLEQIDQGSISVSSEKIVLDKRPQWSLTQTTSNNHYLKQAGIIAEVSLPKETEFRSESFLDVKRGIYFPDEEAMINYWIPFSPAYGYSDGRIGYLHIILPETRIYFESVIQKENTIELRFAGNEFEGGFMFAAAVMSNGKLNHYSQSIDGANLKMKVPAGTTSWDILLCSKSGEFIDSWTNRYISSQSEISADSSFEEIVRLALSQGEGLQTEFKPFLRLSSSARGHRQGKPAKDKFTEILQTVVAMANTNGGKVFIGISDHLELDIDAVVLCEWANCAWDAKVLERYRKALLASLNDRLILSVPISVSCQIIDNAPIIMISIPPNNTGQPSNVGGDATLWIRRGASNKKLPPSEWPKQAESQNFISGNLLA